MHVGRGALFVGVETRAPHLADFLARLHPLTGLHDYTIVVGIVEKTVQSRIIDPDKIPPPQLTFGLPCGVGSHNNALTERK